MTGIQITIDDVGDAKIVEQDLEPEKRCLINHCELVMPEWHCQFSNRSIWEHYHHGWCPAFKWYIGTKYKDMEKAKEIYENTKSIL